MKHLKGSEHSSRGIVSFSGILVPYDLKHPCLATYDDYIIGHVARTK